MTTAAPHVPVLLDEVIDGLAPKAGETHVDGTFGAGGYTRAILRTGARVIAFDRDPDAIAAGQALAAENDGALVLIHDRFSRIAEALEERGVRQVDGVTLDIGVSSMQFDQAERGFSFQADGPLDMRMEQTGMTAADFVNHADEAEIADVIHSLGEEPRARRVARAIVAARPITRTAQLAEVVRRALGHRPHEKKDPATRTFQAIRIHLNAEIDELEQGLAAAERVLRPGGRLAVVSFHSIEDRIVKRFLRERSGATPAGSRHLPDARARGPRPSFEAVAKPVRAGEAEIARNPRSRSATLRIARRTEALPWGLSAQQEGRQG
jgi:16S rRNA (cytosine1402-N4)-methyltransferase